MFRLLKTYLDFINYFRKYVFFYINISKFLQIKKTKLLKLFSIANNVQKFFASRIRIKNVTLLKKKVFRIFQSLFFVLTYFIHYNSTRQLFIDLNFNKEFGINVIIYHVKINVN